MYRALFGAYNAPATLGFYTAHLSHSAWVAMAHAVAMRDLIEAVSGSFRTYLLRFKEDVEPRIAGHNCMLLPVTDSIRDKQYCLKVGWSRSPKSSKMPETFTAGDRFFIAKGTECVWDITKTLRKFYFIA